MISYERTFVCKCISVKTQRTPSECSDPRVWCDSARKSISRNELWKWKNHICHAGHTPIHPTEGLDQPPLLSFYLFFFLLERIDFSWATSYCCVVIETTAALDYRLRPFQTLIKDDSDRSKCHRVGVLKSSLDYTTHYQNALQWQ